MNGETKPKVLVVYFTLTKQSGRVADAMAQALEARGCDVDPHSTGGPNGRLRPRSARLPHLVVPDEHADAVLSRVARGKAMLSGKPFACASVSRRYYGTNLRQMKKLGERNGGRWIDKTHFVSAGGQAKSMLAWLGYMKHGEPQERVFGLKMYPPNLKPDYEEQARSFVDGVVDEAFGQLVAATRRRPRGEARRHRVDRSSRHVWSGMGPLERRA